MRPASCCVLRCATRLGQLPVKALRDVFWGSLGILLGKTSHELWQVPEETPAPITELTSSQLWGILLGISGVSKGTPPVREGFLQPG